MVFITIALLHSLKSGMQVLPSIVFISLTFFFIFVKNVLDILIGVCFNAKIIL